MKKINVGILGISGNVGWDVARILLNHEGVDKIYGTTSEDVAIDQHHRNFIPLKKRPKKLVHLVGHEKLTPDLVDVAFLCAKEPVAMERAQAFIDAGKKVIDLSAAFRFNDAKRFEEVYGKNHTAPNLTKEAVYGLTEFNREAVTKARLIGNPGCYAINAIIALYPLLKAGVLDLKTISIHGENGTSGSSDGEGRPLIHQHADRSILFYSLNGHRHQAEINDQLGKLLGTENVKVNLIPSTAPIVRGTTNTISAKVNPEYKGELSRDALLQLYKTAYENEQFIDVVDFKKKKSGIAKEFDIFPKVADVADSNYTQIGLDYNEGSGFVNIVSVSDNRMKGCGGSGVQNMNLMFGFPEATGLEHLSG
tara:strand:+ start:9445 stop:10539 length:1095 start_codon:yes stop_codon:yes gene_type:complete